MRLVREGAPELRLAYCLNLHPAEDLEQLARGLETITLPLAARLRAGATPFGIGPWIPAALARRLLAPEGAEELERFVALCAEHRLEPFTYNAFPAGGFHHKGLKERVFSPVWGDPAREAYTLDVARLAVLVADRLALAREGCHLSVSTHPGRHGSFARGEEEAAARALGRVVAGLARLEEQHGRRVVLGLEAEPGASSGDQAALAAFLARARGPALEELARALGTRRRGASAKLARHLGACLDACHAAVAFEAPEAAFGAATARGPLAKLQLSSALALRRPGESPEGVGRLLALDEERYLHQVVARLAGGKQLEQPDLPALRARLAAGDAAWREAREWRCHFHVPLDQAGLGEGLRTTRAECDRLLAVVLAQAPRWGTEHLHLEIETYTWEVLPAQVRGPGALVDGLEREYCHVLERLGEHGWHPA